MQTTAPSVGHAATPVLSGMAAVPVANGAPVPKADAELAVADGKSADEPVAATCLLMGCRLIASSTGAALAKMVAKPRRAMTADFIFRLFEGWR